MSYWTLNNNLAMLWIAWVPRMLKQWLHCNIPSEYNSACKDFISSGYIRLRTRIIHTVSGRLLCDLQMPGSSSSSSSLLYRQLHNLILERFVWLLICLFVSEPYPGGIGFTACVSVGDLDNLGDHHTILFDKIITNTGSAYHDNTGIFIAPFKGKTATSVLTL